MRFVGQSGLLALDPRTGERTDFSLELRQLLPDGGVATVGAWTTREGLMWKGQPKRMHSKGGTLGEVLARKSTLKISTVLVSFGPIIDIQYCSFL